MFVGVGDGVIGAIIEIVITTRSAAIDLWPNCTILFFFVHGKLNLRLLGHCLL